MTKILRRIEEQWGLRLCERKRGTRERGVGEPRVGPLVPRFETVQVRTSRGTGLEGRREVGLQILFPLRTSHADAKWVPGIQRAHRERAFVCWDGSWSLVASYLFILPRSIHLCSTPGLHRLPSSPRSSIQFGPDPSVSSDRDQKRGPRKLL